MSRRKHVGRRVRSVQPVPYVQTETDRQTDTWPQRRAGKITLRPRAASIFTARCYSAVYLMGMCLFVSLSDTNRCFVETTGLVELVFGTETSLDLPYSAVLANPM